MTKEEVLNYIDKHLSYEEKTGKFIWKNPSNNRVKAGQEAGCKNSSGHTRIIIEGKQYQAHRLAWLVTYGNWPKHSLRHINGNKLDNRISNLEEIEDQYLKVIKDQKRLEYSSVYVDKNNEPLETYSLNELPWENGLLRTDY